MIKAQLITIDKEDKETTLESALDESLTIEYESNDTIKSVQINAHTTSNPTLIETKQTGIRPLHEGERANLHVSSDTKDYIFKTNYKTTELILAEDIDQEDGTLVNYHFILKDGGGKSYTTGEKEAHIEGKKLSQKFDLAALCEEVKLELSHLASFEAFVDDEQSTKHTGSIKYLPLLQDDVWQKSNVLNPIAEGKENKVYKKTTPITQGDEVKRIQEALQKMKIDIGKDGVDGKFGNDEYKAVMTFQRQFKPSHHVHEYSWSKPDGIVGKNTLLAMDEALISGWKYRKIYTKVYIIDHIPVGSSHRPAKSMSPEYLTIHSTGNPNSTAQGERNYLTNVLNTSSTGFHIVVDANKAIECIPFSENAYHAGDGVNGTGNNKSIGLEIIESGDRSKTLDNAIKLAAQILIDYDLGIDKLKRHYDWSQKNCPRILLKPTENQGESDQTWDWFKSKVEELI